VFPVKTHLYGVPDAPLFPYRISPADITKEADPEEDFLEIPFAKQVRNIQFHRNGVGA
jgi:hypothetical protein